MMCSRRLHGAEYFSREFVFFIFNQSRYDPGRDRSRDQWYRSWMPYRKATAAVGFKGELSKFLLYIFIPSFVKE